MDGINELIRKGLITVTMIKEIRHPVNEAEIEHLKTVNDVLLHSASILSDIQEMLRANYPKEQINSEINESKFFIFKTMEFFEKNPICPLKEICPYYKKAKQLRIAKP